MTRIVLMLSIFTAILTAQPVRISGRVAANDGKPVEDARVRLQLVGGTSVDTKTDVQGAFKFEVTGDPNLLSIEKTGFTSTAVTQLGQRETLSNLFVKLQPENTISGRVVDADGNPVAKAKITKLAYVYFRGERSLRGMGGKPIVTGADGTYRVDNLPAGRYYVRVEAVKDLNATYYPNTTDPAAAAAVDLDSGAVRSGIDIRMRREPVFHIKGKAVDESGTPVANVNVSIDAEHAVLTQQGLEVKKTAADGSFEFEGLLPNSYVIRAIPRAEARYAGRVTVPVRREDVDDARIVVTAGFALAGSVAMEDGAALPAPPKTATPPKEGTIGALGLRMSLMDAERGVTQGILAAAISLSTGTFRMAPIIPGKYYFVIDPLPPNVYVKSIRVGGLDVTRTPIDMTYGGAENLNVVLGSKAAEIHATVHDRDGKTLPGVRVVLWPDVADHGSAGSGVRLLESDSNGVVSVQGLRPEKYHLAAFADVENAYMLYNVDFLGHFKSRAEAIDVSDGAMLERSLEPISREDAAAVIRDLP